MLPKRWDEMAFNEVATPICHCSISHEHFISPIRLARLWKKQDKHQPDNLDVIASDANIDFKRALYFTAKGFADVDKGSEGEAPTCTGLCCGKFSLHSFHG